MVFHHLVVAHAGRTKMQSEDAGFSASSLSAHERYWVDTPARGCLMIPAVFLCPSISRNVRIIGTQIVGQKILQSKTYALSMDIRFVKSDGKVGAHKMCFSANI